MTGEPPTGVYWGDTRIIGQLVYFLDDQRILPTGVDREGFSLTYTYNTAHGSFTRRVEVVYGGLIERVSHAPSGLVLRLTPDFSDIFEVRGVVSRDSLGVPKPVAKLSSEGDGVLVHYLGTDSRARVFKVKANGRLTLNDGLEATPRSGDLTLKVLLTNRVRRPSVTYAKYTEDFPRISADDDLLVRAYESSARDLFSLLEAPPNSWFPLAGVPYFNCVFGRDSLIVGFQTLMFSPRISLSVLERLSTHIGRKVDKHTEEEPGKVVHEVRRGELSGRLTPFKAYYGSVDATPLFVALYHEFKAFHPSTPPNSTVERAARMGLEWVTSKIDTHGFLGYTPGVLRNQGWKDSDDSVFHSDGSPLRPPIYLVEAQGYADLALRLAASMGGDQSRRLLEKSSHLREKIGAAFWSPKINYYSEALDGEGERAEIVTSNPGHLLWSGSVEHAQAERIASMLSDPEQLNSGYGVKTLGFHELRHDAESYHNGSVWPHDNSLIIKGLSDYGFTQELDELVSGLLKAYKALGINGFPEHYSGFKACGDLKPKPLGCYPQAWAAGAVFLVTQAILGISVTRGDEGYVVRIKPHLPARLSRLKVGDLHVLGGRLRVDVVRVGGDLKVRYEFTVKPSVQFRVEV